MIRKLWFTLGPIGVATVVSILLLGWLFGHTKTEFEHAALDLQTSVQMATYRGVKIHGCDVPDVPAILEGWQRRGSHPFVLFLGNSQLHAINQLRPGDHCVPALLGDPSR